MIIANPIYDVVFKRLMENDRVVKFFIGTLLKQTVESVEVKPVKFDGADKFTGFTISKINIIANVKTEDGVHKKILIEILRPRNHISLMLFLIFLDEQNKKKKEEIENNRTTMLPITTIFILGFTIPEIETPCMRVEQQYKDLINKTIITKKCEFAEKLTNDSVIIQIQRITDRYQTRLDKLLSFFVQSDFADDLGITKNYTHKPDIEDLEIITNLLHHSGTDPEERKLIDTEKEAWRIVNAMFENEIKEFEKQMNEKNKALIEKEQVITEKERVIAEKERVIAEKEQIITEMERVITEKERVITEKEQAIAEMEKIIE